ncbi:MAG: hypothetical protein EXS64_17055 [Candidatus Latescibacteria bacterium]|nr:hypothetical protein [Candidatus Latescibacterota bacterium]
MTAIEMTGTVDENRQLLLDGPLPIAGPARVKVIVLYSLTEDLNEAEWLRLAAHNPVFADLNDSEEDIYSLQDGKPLQ